MAAARSLLQDLYVTEADILPQPEKNLLLVRVHNASRPAANKKIEQLFNHLNEAKMKYPGTKISFLTDQLSRAYCMNAKCGLWFALTRRSVSTQYGSKDGGEQFCLPP